MVPCGVVQDMAQGDPAPDSQVGSSGQLLMSFPHSKPTASQSQLPCIQSYGKTILPLQISIELECDPKEAGIPCLY